MPKVALLSQLVNSLTVKVGPKDDPGQLTDFVRVVISRLRRADSQYILVDGPILLVFLQKSDCGTFKSAVEWVSRKKP